MHDIDLASRLISDQEADLVSIGRAAITNPDLPNKLKNGEPMIPFFKELISDSLTLSYTQQLLASNGGSLARSN
jgi:2,4-dienoyl-CoA reductase-like NADH-dependent reductase (Old Yellow Enzyme family)